MYAALSAIVKPSRIVTLGVYDLNQKLFLLQYIPHTTQWSLEWWMALFLPSLRRYIGMVTPCECLMAIIILASVAQSQPGRRKTCTATMTSRVPSSSVTQDTDGTILPLLFGLRVDSWPRKFSKLKLYVDNNPYPTDEGPHLSSVIQKTKDLGSCPSPAISWWATNRTGDMRDGPLPRRWQKCAAFPPLIL